jgi:hypothetical protein
MCAHIKLFYLGEFTRLSTILTGKHYSAKALNNHSMTSFSLWASTAHTIVKTASFLLISGGKKNNVKLQNAG